MFNDELKLINRVPNSRNSKGKVIYKETETTLLCEVVNVSKSEYFEGAQAGITPEYEFLINPIEYNGETVIEYRSRKYRVYRSYVRDDDVMELYCEFITGLNGGAS